MSAVYLTPTQESLVKKAAIECDFKEFDVVAKSGSLKGDNYLGIINAVTVKEKNEEKKVLHLILKSAHTNDFFRKVAYISEAFKRESYLYSTVLPKLLSYQDENAISQPFTGVARFYGCCLEDKNESILLQNLKECGYELWDRMKPMNDEHISLVFAEYARFHAASLAFKVQHPKAFEDLTKDIQLNKFESDTTISDEEKFDKYFKIYFKIGLSAVEGNDKAKAALEKLSSKMANLLQEQLAPEKNNFLVIHGDCWCNNMLFKYKENGRNPSKVCFIDWQLSKLASPAMDLAYFFSVCGSKEVYPNLSKYLNLYHQVMSQNLREFGCDPEEVFSLEVLTNEWNKNAWYGVFLAMKVMKLMLSESEEAPNISDGNLDGKSIMNSLVDFNMSKLSTFKTRLCDLIEFMDDNNYI